MAVGRHVGDLCLVQLPRRVAGDVLAIERDRAGGRLAQPDDRLDQLVLAVPGHPGDPEDLAGADLEVDAPLTICWPRSSLGGQALDVEHGRGRMRDASVHDQLDLAADHQLGQVVLVGLGRLALADHPSAPNDRDPVGDLEDLVQLVADEHDAVALGGEPPQDREDLVGLLGRQHGGGFVEDEDPRIAIERLEDLDPLLPADRQRAHLGLGVDLEAEPAAELDDPAVRLVAVEEEAVGHRLLAEEDVLGDGQDGDEHEVLVDHADAAGDGVGRAGDPDRRPVEEDLALVGRGQPVQDVHQGRLAGAVLAEQGVDLARAGPRG